MTEQQMPARIWARNPNGKCVVSFTIGDFDYKTPYIRSDIAERMAEALDNVRTVIEFSLTPCHKDQTGTWLETINRIDSALSAFRSSTQDTEARHE